MTKKSELKINATYQALIPPLASDEFQMLEESIIKYGVQESIKAVHTDDGDVLIDGHHRYQIAQLHGLEFKVEFIDLKNENEIKMWMLKNQMGRRNITTKQKIIYAKAIADLQFGSPSQVAKALPTPHAPPKAPVIPSSSSSSSDEKVEKPVKKTKEKAKYVEKIAKEAGVSVATASKAITVMDARPDEFANPAISIEQSYKEIKKEEKKAEKKEEVKVEKKDYVVLYTESQDALVRTTDTIMPGDDIMVICKVIKITDIEMYPTIISDVEETLDVSLSLVAMFCDTITKKGMKPVYYMIYATGDVDTTQWKEVGKNEDMFENLINFGYLSDITNVNICK